MSEVLKSLFEYALGYFQQAFAEVSIVLFSAGTLLLLLGIVTLAATVYTRVVGYRVTGTVVGAVKETTTKNKTRNGRTVQKTSTFYHAVFAYPRADGTRHQEKASEGGDHVLQYRTGQTVNLLVVPASGDDDVYDADRKTGYLLSGFLLVPGAALMVQAASMSAALGITIPTLLVAMLGLIMKTRRSRKGRTRTVGKHYKIIDPGAIRPIEEFAAHK